MWIINHTFRYRGETFVQSVKLPGVVNVNRKAVWLGSAFAAEAYYARSLGDGFEHTQIEAEENNGD
jgi:hypothetical protein